MQRFTRLLSTGLLLVACLLTASCSYDDGNNYYYCCGYGGTGGYSGTISGLPAGASVMVQDNTGVNATISANGSFSFATYVPPGYPALVGVLIQPAGQNCTVANGALNSAGSGIVSVTITCAPVAAGVTSLLSAFAGMLYQGSANGSATAASFNGPSGIATDASGNIYVADTCNNTIRKVTPAGLVTTLAGTAGVYGNADGSGAAASFRKPYGVATDSAGNVYVADTNNSTIRKITPAGVVTTLAGTAGVYGSADGTGAAASFRNPYGVATDSAGSVYVADTNNNTIRKITPAGVVTTLAGTAGYWGSADGTGAAARFNAPVGVATDARQNVYVADYYNDTIRMITPAGVVTTLAGTAGYWGSADGTGAAARFNGPQGVATDAAGDIYVADTYNYEVRKVTSAGVVTTVVGVAAQPVFSAGELPGSLEGVFGVAQNGTSLFATSNGGVALVTDVP